jgi:transcriptional regulator with XRE-family HTH domain
MNKVTSPEGSGTALAAGLTQDEVAGRLKRPQSFVAKYEGGERRIDVVEFIDIVRALEQEPLQVFEELVSSTEESRPKRWRARRG